MTCNSSQKQRDRIGMGSSDCIAGKYVSCRPQLFRRVFWSDSGRARSVFALACTLGCGWHLFLYEARLRDQMQVFPTTPPVRVLPCDMYGACTFCIGTACALKQLRIVLYTHVFTTLRCSCAPPGSSYYIYFWPDVIFTTIMSTISNWCTKQ